MTKRKFRLSKKIVISALVIAVILSGIFYWQHNKNKSVNTDIKKQPTSNPYVNLNPPTAAEKKASEDAKAAIAQRQSHPSDSTNSKKTVTPTIVHADSSSVSAYVSNLLEDGGTCTATFVQGNTQKSFSAKASANVSYTACDQINITGLSSGTWELTVTYTSSTATGSVVKTLNI